MPQGIVQQDKEVRSSQAKQANNPPEKRESPRRPNNIINMPYQIKSPPEMRPFPCAEFTLCALLSLGLRHLRVHAVHRVHLIHLIRPGRAGVLCHASVVPWPAGEELPECLVLC